MWSELRQAISITNKGKFWVYLVFSAILGFENSHADNIVSRIYIDVFTSDTGRQIGTQKGTGITNIFSSYISTQGRVMRNLVEYFLKVTYASGG